MVWHGIAVGSTNLSKSATLKSLCWKKLEWMTHYTMTGFQKNRCCTQQSSVLGGVSLSEFHPETCLYSGNWCTFVIEAMGIDPELWNPSNANEFPRRHLHLHHQNKIYQQINQIGWNHPSYLKPALKIRHALDLAILCLKRCVCFCGHTLPVLLCVRGCMDVCNAPLFPLGAV